MWRPNANTLAAGDGSIYWQGPGWLERLIAWCSGHERLLLAAIAGAQLAVLGGMIVVDALPLVVGETVVLPVQPVDPRDLFRGDYVILQYDFSRPGMPARTGVPSAAVASPAAPVDGWKEDQPVYVTLARSADSGHWQATSIRATPPPAGATYLRGRYTGGQFLFGIEAFYVQEGTGRVLEQARNRGELMAEVAVAPWGQAALRELHVNSRANRRPAGDPASGS